MDDDALFLKMLELEFLMNSDFVLETYATGESCIENLANAPDIIILDYHLDGVDINAMNGIETLDKIKKNNPTIPIVILSSQDKIEVAINCMHHLAFDYVVKSETAFMRLQKIISTILYNKQLENKLNWYINKM